MGLKINHPYTWAELEKLTQDPTLEEFKLKGYVLRGDADGTFTFVHWSEASFGGQGGPLAGRVYNPHGFEDIAPIVKRTPQERVDSLLLKIMDDCKRYQTVPGFTDSKISEILGEPWETGKDEMTAERTRKVAAYFLTKAEAEAKERARHQVTSAPTT